MAGGSGKPFQGVFVTIARVICTQWNGSLSSAKWMVPHQYTQTPSKLKSNHITYVSAFFPWTVRVLYSYFGTSLAFPLEQINTCWLRLVLCSRAKKRSGNWGAFSFWLSAKDLYFSSLYVLPFDTSTCLTKENDTFYKVYIGDVLGWGLLVFIGRVRI